jgi:adhesin HecA-like repeat protein
MKTFFLILTLSASAVHSYSQGTIVYYNRVANSVVAPVYGPGTGGPGNTPTGFPAGTQTYSAPGLAGTGYCAGLWAGPVGSTLEQLTFVPGSLKTFRTGGFAGAIDNSGGVIAIPGVSEGSPAVLQLRAWDNQGGTITTYDDALIRGASRVFN